MASPAVPSLSASATSRTRKRTTLSLSRKLEIVSFAEKTSNSAAAKKFGVTRQQIIIWRKSKTALEAGKGTKKRLDGAGRKQLFSILNDRVRDWILEKREKRQCVSRRLILLEAKKIASEMEKSGEMPSGTRTFSGSLGWLEKFLRRNQFSLRVPTTTCQRPPVDSAPKLVDFVLFIRSQREQHQYAQSNIFACDETAVWLDPTGRRCVTHRGARDVTVTTLGHEKVHITVMLCAKADGSKCKPFVLLPRKRPVPEIVQKFSGKLVLNWAGRVWMDNSLTEEFLRRIIGPLSFGKRLLIWDAFRCHLSRETKAGIAELNVHQAVVPGGCTKYVQAPDVCWNQPFKAAITQSHEDWMASGENREYTRSGNPKPPPMMVYLQWVCDAWDQLPTDLIKGSFKACGITNAVDGSEDNLIHCFKPHGPIPEGLALLKEKSAVAEAPAVEPEDEYDESVGVLQEIEIVEAVAVNESDSESSTADDDDDE